jgi:hypothetical protein
MAEPRPRPPAAGLPTLTEVVAEGEGLRRAATAEVTPADEARIVDAVIASLQQRTDLMFEYRLREALSPLLTRLAETLVSEAREELSRTLRDVVARAVSQELARRRTR